MLCVVRKSLNENLMGTLLLRGEEKLQLGRGRSEGWGHSVTRFSEISPLGPNFKSLWQKLKIYLALSKILNLLSQFFHLIGQF